MQITAICPKCENRYQFDAALVGQKIRCTNASCREIFQVREAPAETPKAAKPGVRDRRAPTFDSEHGTARTDEPREADWSKLPPPPVRRRDEPAEEMHEAAETHEPVAATPDEVLAFMGMAPAAATTTATDDDYTLPAEMPPEEVYEIGEDVAEEEEAQPGEYFHHYQKPKRRWLWMVMFGAVMFVGVLGIGAFFVMKSQKAKNETVRFEAAEKNLKESQYATAARDFDDMVKNYPSSKNRDRYVPLGRIARMLERATDPAIAVHARRTELVKELADMRDKGQYPIVEEYKTHFSKAFVRIAEDQVRDAAKLFDEQQRAKAADRNYGEANQKIKEVQDILVEIRGFVEGGKVPDDLRKKLDDAQDRIRDGERYSNYLRELIGKIKGAKPATVTNLEKDAKEKGYANKPEVVALFEDAAKELQKQITFVPDVQAAQPVPGGGPVSLILGPNIDKIPENPQVVFAVARGVMYALAQHKGQVLWAARVGIDVTSLPVVVPGVGGPATVISPTPDGPGLIARDSVTGQGKWQIRLPAPARGQPVFYRGRLYLPLADEKGTVVVIDSRNGQKQGHIELGQLLGPGASLQPGSSRLFVPADSVNVFVLDVNPQDLNKGLAAFIAVLPTGHGPASLRSEPVVVGGIDEVTGQPAGNAYMILSQSDGFDNMRLRSFVLTSNATDGTLSITPSVEERLSGWAWFPPVCDQEKVAVVTDTGAFALLGINQKDNNDNTLFKLMVEEPKTRVAAGRGQVVLSEGDSGFWYLAGGEMYFKRKGFDRKDGQKLADGWKAPLKLGTPLHAAQVSPDRTTLFVVTQTTSPPAWQITAVNAQSGEIVWQRPLGLAIQGDPIKFADMIYTIDQGAGAYRVDPNTAPVQAGPEAALTGQVLAIPRGDVFGETYLMPHRDGKLAFLIFATEGGRKLNVSVIAPDQKASTPITVMLPAPLAGAPILNDKTLTMALTDAGLYRWTIGDSEAKRGPDWRVRQGETARAYLAAVGKDGILVSNGYRGVTLFNWPIGAEHQLKQTSDDFADRITSAPVVIPMASGAPHVALTLAGGRVVQLDGDTLAMVQTWEMTALRKGVEVTAGPFLVDAKGQPRLVVVADRATLVCLVPDKAGQSVTEAWSYKVAGDGVHHAPRQIGSTLIIADVSGRFESIDVIGGEKRGGPFPALAPLPAAPAASPIEYGPDKLFAPMSDGTILVIPREALLPK